MKVFRSLINKPHSYNPFTAARHMSSDVQWTKSDTWDEIWQILPPDTDGILAHARENILSEVIKPRDIPYLQAYLSTLIINTFVIPIVWDFDHRTLDFLGDDIQDCLTQLRKSITDNTTTIRA